MLLLWKGCAIQTFVLENPDAMAGLAALLQDASIPDACVDAIAEILSVEVSRLQYVEAHFVPARLELMMAVAVDVPGQSPTVPVLVIPLAAHVLFVEHPFDVSHPCRQPRVAF